MENFRPLSSDLGDLRELAEALGGVLQVLELTQLIPPTGEPFSFSWLMDFINMNRQFWCQPARGWIGKPHQTPQPSPSNQVTCRPRQGKSCMSPTSTVVNAIKPKLLISMNKSSHPPRSSSPAGPCPPDEIDMVTPANHLDFSIILPLFPNITEIRLCFQVDKAEKQSIAMTHCRCNTQVKGWPLTSVIRWKSVELISVGTCSVWQKRWERPSSSSTKPLDHHHCHSGRWQPSNRADIVHKTCETQHQEIYLDFSNHRHYLVVDT